MNIKVNGVTKLYNRRTIPALNDISLDIPAGVFGLIGRNGAGKTTLLRIMATVLQTTNFSIICAYLKELKAERYVKAKSSAVWR
jgi:ABC-type multidrug transport system ATPase subunit